MFETIIERFRKRRFKAWQIEITTRCPLKCVMCIRRSEKNLEEKDMEVGDFKKIVPYLKDVEIVVLEGWGESLLHKDLVEIVSLVKTQRAKAGFVTSGFGLDKGYIELLREAGLDFIGFSLSGATAKTHNSIRVNSDLEGLLESMKYISKITGTKPKVHIVYLLLKENIHELPLLVDLAKGVGVHRIVLINIIQVSNKTQDDGKVFSLGEKNPYEELMDHVRKKAKRLGVDLFVPRFSPQPVSVCSEDPLNNLYISVDGEVSPCVYLYPPVKSPFRRLFCGEEKILERLSFGNIFDMPFNEIWNDNDYKAFRESFMERKKASEMLMRAIFDMKMCEPFSFPDAPEFCRTCYKMLGF